MAYTTLRQTRESLRVEESHQRAFFFYVFISVVLRMTCDDAMSVRDALGIFGSRREAIAIRAESLVMAEKDERRTRRKVLGVHNGRPAVS